MRRLFARQRRKRRRAAVAFPTAWCARFESDACVRDHGRRGLAIAESCRGPAGVFRQPRIVQARIAGRLVAVDEKGALSTLRRNLALQRAYIEQDILAVQSGFGENHDGLFGLAGWIEDGQSGIWRVVL